MKKQTRSQARDAAFTQVFQMNMHEDDMDVILEELLNARPECETNLGYIRQIIDGVKEHESELEDTVAKYGNLIMPASGFLYHGKGKI